MSKLPISEQDFKLRDTAEWVDGEGEVDFIIVHLPTANGIPSHDLTLKFTYHADAKATVATLCRWLRELGAIQ